MKRFFLLGLAALGLAAAVETVAFAIPPFPPGIGSPQRRVGRVKGYWKQPSRGPLYDYSSYFAGKYPQLPGAAEYQYSPQGPYGAGAGAPIAGGPVPPGYPTPVAPNYGPIELRPRTANPR